jgi:hypothetical protein
MAIEKPGFTLGFRGRQQAAGLGRRAFYLVAEHDRDSVRLLDAEGRVLTAQEAIALMGGSQAEYHEVILAPSEAECRHIEARNPGTRQQAIEATGLRVIRAQAKGRNHFLAIHEQDGRFHYHLIIAGPMPERTLGRYGSVQKQWRLELLGDEPRIQDWEAHRRFKDLQAQLRLVIEEQRGLARERREAVRVAEPDRKREVAHPYDQRAITLLSTRHALELAAIHARYEARGSLGTSRHFAEVEQAEHRHTTAQRSLDRRMLGRALPGHSQGRGAAVRALTHGAERLARGVAERALGGDRMPEPLRKGTRISLALAAGAVESVIRRQIGARSLDLPAAAPPSRLPGVQAAQVLTRALPEHETAQALGSLACTALKAAQDLATNPPQIISTLVHGGVDLVLAGTQRMGQPLSEPLQKAFEAAGWVPGVGIAAKVLEKGVAIASPRTPSTSPHMELER